MRVLILAAVATMASSQQQDDDGGIPNLTSSSYSGSSDVMPLTILSPDDPGVAGGGVCLDGSPPWYYLGRSATKSKTWVIQFQGGGWSYSPSEAVSRSMTSLGSSTKAASSYTYPYGPLSSDPGTNPMFYDANRVLLAYCDAGSFAGHLSEPLEGIHPPVYIRGKMVLDALFGALMSEGFVEATDVLLTGTSAGGLAAFLHADYVRSALLPSTVTRYGVMPISGFFLNHADLNGDLTYGTELRNVFAYQNSTSGMNSACVAAKASSQSDCIFANETAVFVTSPLFVQNSMVDSWQLQNIWEQNMDDPCTSNSTAQFQSCSDAQIDQINAYGSDFLSDLLKVVCWMLCGTASLFPLFPRTCEYTLYIYAQICPRF